MMDIMKPPEAMTNTYGVAINGLLIEQCGDEDKYYNERYTVFFTSDEHGESLSISAENTPFQYHLKFSDVEKLVAHTRMQRKDGLKQ